MINLYPVLRQYMNRAGVSWSEMAAIAGVHNMVFHLRMWGIMQWKLTEVLRICCFFNTPDAEHLFVRNHSKSQ